MRTRTTRCSKSCRSVAVSESTWGGLAHHRLEDADDTLDLADPVGFQQFRRDEQFGAGLFRANGESQGNVQVQCLAQPAADVGGDGGGNMPSSIPVAAFSTRCALGVSWRGCSSRCSCAGSVAVGSNAPLY